jgi:hypothetical protein
MRKERSMISRFKNTFVLALLAGFLFFSCNQDSIFYDISKEIEPKDPLIPGGPTNIVVSNNVIYAASIGSSRVYSYKDSWSVPYSVSGGIRQLAATTSHVYAITSDTLYQLDVPGASASPGGNNLQTVYGAGDRVFVGTGTGSNSVVCYSDTSTLSLVTLDSTISGLLKGAVIEGTDYYIATTSGIYKISGNTVSIPLSGNFMGIIKTDTYISAITENGSLYYFEPASFPSTVVSLDSLGGIYTGAMATYTQPGETNPSLLLLGVYSSPYGYREVSLDNTGKPSGGAQTPGSGAGSSIKDKAKYEASIAKHAVYSICQVSTSPPIIFASTYQNGLWSLRGDEWNAEE